MAALFTWLETEDCGFGRPIRRAVILLGC